MDKFNYLLPPDRTKIGISTCQEAFTAWLKSLQAEQRYKNAKLIQAWASLTGDNINKRTEKVWVKDQILYVKLTSAPLKKELQMSKSMLMAKIFDYMREPVITDIIFV